MKIFLNDEKLEIRALLSFLSLFPGLGPPGEKTTEAAATINM